MEGPRRPLDPARKMLSVAPLPTSPRGRLKKLPVIRHYGILTMNSFQSETLEKIRRRFPEWKAISKPAAHQIGEEIFVFEIQSPLQAGGNSILKVFVDTKGITVSFDAFHSHFNSWMDSKALKSAQLFIEGLLDETIAIVSWWDDDRLDGASSFFPKKRLPQAGTRSRFNRQVIRSWKGTYNSEIRKA